MKIERILVCTAVLSMSVSSTSIAQPEDAEPASEAVEQEEEFKNGLLFGFTHAFRLETSSTASEPRRSDHVYGFQFGYERVLHRYVALSIIKPFYFNRERTDSALEIVVTGLYRKNSWEPFLGAGIVSTVGSVKESEAEGESVSFTFGLLFIAGFKYFVTPQWGIELEFGYSYVPKNNAVEHEFVDSYQGVYFF